jgi:8-oxo-dGTP pyrophosphatase MutT (NUDIX family)
MHRTQLLNLLTKYQPPNTQEAVYKQQMVEFINHFPNCFERTLAIGHITASSWLLNHDMSQVLLMHHAKLDKWFQLGGHCDGDSDVLAVAIKEAQEESGMQAIEAVSKDIFDIDIHMIPANSREQAHYHYDVRFLLRVSQYEKLVQNRESKELRWIGAQRAELPTTNASIVRMFEKWQQI